MEEQEKLDSTYLGSPDNPKTAGIVCYITIFGWLIAYFALYRYRKDSVAAYHIRQTLLLHIISIVLNVLTVLALWGMFPYAVVVILVALLLIAWLIGLSGAAIGKKRAAPFIGKWAQEIFSRL